MIAGNHGHLNPRPVAGGHGRGGIRPQGIDHPDQTKHGHMMEAVLRITRFLEGELAQIGHGQGQHPETIVGGIKQGRLVYNNIRKVIFLLISTGAAEVFLFVLSLIFALPMPLYPLQLLWLNLVTNGLQDVALAFEPEEGHELEAPPRPPGEPIFNRLMIERVVINALVMGSIAFALYAWLLGQGMDVASARNLVLLQMVLFENVHVFNSRSEKISIFRQNFFGNPLLLGGMLGAQALHIGSMFTPGLRDVLQVQPVSLQQWGTLLGFASVLILVDELHKLWHGRFGGERSAAKHA